MNLSEEARATRNAYMRTYLKKWHAQNPEKGALYTARYWEKKAKELQEVKKLQATKSKGDK